MLFKQHCKFFSMFNRIVYAAEQYIFKRKPLAAFKSFFKGLCCRHKLADRPSLVYRHQPVSQLVIWRRKRDRKVWASVKLSEFKDLWHNTNRRNRYAARNNKQSLFVGHYFQGLDQILKVLKRFSLAHRDEICPVRRFTADSLNIVHHGNYLLNDLAAGQIPEQA